MVVRAMKKHIRHRICSFIVNDLRSRQEGGGLG